MSVGDSSDAETSEATKTVDSIYQLIDSVVMYGYDDA